MNVATVLFGMDLDDELTQLLRDVVDEYRAREPEDKIQLLEDIQEILFDD